MLLSIQQQYVMDLLRNVGSLRKNQLLIMLQQRFASENMKISDRRLEAILRQLRTCVGEIRVENEIVRLDQAQPDWYWLEAIDIMLELSGRTPPHYKARLPPPLLLRFVLDGDASSVFAVAAWKDRNEALPVLNRQGEQRVIWLSDTTQPPAALSLPPDHFLAVRKKDGTHRFYGSQEPQS